MGLSIYILALTFMECMHILLLWRLVISCILHVLNLSISWLFLIGMGSLSHALTSVFSKKVQRNMEVILSHLNIDTVLLKQY